MKRESETRRWKEVSFEETCKVPSIFQFEVEFFSSSILDILYIFYMEVEITWRLEKFI